MMTTEKAIEAEAPAQRDNIATGFELKKPPFRPWGWNILVQIPEPPEKSAGGILLTEVYRDHTEFALSVGVIAAVGDAAFEAETKARIKLSRLHNPNVGDWVIFDRHAGSRRRMRDGTMYVLMSDTEVKGFNLDLDQFDHTVLD